MQSAQAVPYTDLHAESRVFVRSYTRALNVELKSQGIICTAVCPGWIDTERLAKILGYGKNTKDISITNLTRLDIPVEYGEYRLTDLTTSEASDKVETTTDSAAALNLLSSLTSPVVVNFSLNTTYAVLFSYFVIVI